MSDAELLRRAIANGPMGANEPVANGSEWTRPLQIAARCGDYASAEQLLNWGARLEDCNDDGRTACHAAAFAGAADVMALLRERGADLTRCDLHNLSPLGVAVYNKWEILAIELIESGVPLNNADVLCEAAALSGDLIRALCNRGIDVKSLRDSFGRSPLHFAVRHGDNFATVRALLDECGVDVDARDRGGVSCFHDCAYYGTTDYLCLLADRGAAADADRGDARARTPLHHACANFRTDIVYCLLAMGLDVHARNEWGETPALVMASCRSIDRAMLAALLVAGADWDAADDEQNTVRSHCARLGHEPPSAAELDAARRRLAAAPLECVRERAVQVSVGLHALELDALQMCAILEHACGPAAPAVPFHRWWQIATLVKHFPRR